MEIINFYYGIVFYWCTLYMLSLCKVSEVVTILSGTVFITARIARMYRFCLVCVCIPPGAKN